MSRRAAAVECNDDVIAVRHPLIDHVAIGLRDHLLVSGAGIDIEDHWVMLAFFKIAWADDRRIHRARSHRARQLERRQ